MADRQILSETRAHHPAGIMTRGRTGSSGALADTFGTRGIALACAVLVALGTVLQLEPAFPGRHSGDQATLEAQSASISRAITGTERELDRFLSEPRRIAAHPGIFRQLQADLTSLRDRGNLLEATISELQRASAGLPDTPQGAVVGRPMAWVEATFTTATRAVAPALLCGRDGSDGPGIRMASVVAQATSDGSLQPLRCTAGTNLSAVLGDWEVLKKSDPGDHVSASERGNPATSLPDGSLGRGTPQQPAGAQCARQRESRLMPDICSL